jgi:hypothetical protein
MNALRNTLTALLGVILLCSLFFAHQDPFSKEDPANEIELLRRQISVLERRTSNLERRLDELTKARVVPLVR